MKPVLLTDSCIFVLALLALLLDVGNGRVVQGLDNPEESAKAAIVACEANLTAFRMYKCRYSITKAEAASVETALRGELINARKCDYIIVVDGERKKLHSYASRQLPKTAKRTASSTSNSKKPYTMAIAIDCESFTDLRLGEVGLSYQPFMETAYVHGKDMKMPDSASVPLTLWGALPRDDLFSFSARLKRCAQGKEAMLVTGMTQIDQVPVFELNFTADWGDGRYYFDPQRGYLPSRIMTWIKKGRIGKVELDGSRAVLAGTTYLLEAKEFSRKRWFPTHVVSVSPLRDKPGDPVFVQDFRITELEVDKQPSDEEFTADIPAGTMVEWYQDKGQFFRLRQDEQVLPSDIPRLAGMLERVAKVRLMDTAVHPHARTRWWAWGLAAGGVFLLCGTAVYRRFRPA